MSPAPLPLPVDEAWEALRAQLEWRRGFGLFFLFVPHQGAGTLLRERIAAWLQIHTLRLRLLKCESSGFLERELIAALFIEAGSAPPQTPFWIEAENRPFDDEWNRARSVFLARLNEQRGALEADVSGPLIIVLPLDFRYETRRIAPDLWHVRVWSGELPVANPSSESDKWSIEASVSAELPVPQSSGEMTYSASADAALAIWRGVLAAVGPAKNRIYLEAGFEAFDRVFELQRYADARSIAGELLAISRERVASGDPSALRDLSVSLDKVGGVDEALGRLEAARAAYAESLTLCRKINAAVGETPQGLRDLSVSLNKVGGVDEALGRLEAARAAYAESLALRRKINAAVGETPQGLYDLAYSLHKLGKMPLAGTDASALQPWRTEATAILKRLRDAVGPMWNGINLNNFIEQTQEK